MKVDLAGLLKNAARVIRDHGCKAPYDRTIAFGLEEAARHIEQVRKGEATLAEFCECYCLPAPTWADQSVGEAGALNDQDA